MLQQSKIAWRKTRKLAERRQIAQTAAGTCLFRPSDHAASFPMASRKAITRKIAATTGVSQVRVNTRSNVVTADAETDECLAALLATLRVAGTVVRAGRSASRGTTRGLVFGVDLHLTTEDIHANTDSEVAVSSVAHKANGAVLLVFAALCPPAFVAVFKLAAAACAQVPPAAHAVRSLRPPGPHDGLLQGQGAVSRFGGSHTTQPRPPAAPTAVAAMLLLIPAVLAGSTSAG